MLQKFSNCRHFQETWKDGKWVVEKREQELKIKISRRMSLSTTSNENSRN